MDWEIIWAFDQATPWILAMAFLPVGMFLFGLWLRAFWLTSARSEKMRAYGHSFLLVWLAVVAVFAVFFIPARFSDYLDLRARYQNADYDVIEGTLEEFQAGGYREGVQVKARRDRAELPSPASERFRVAGIEFFYHPQIYECHCFNNAGRSAGFQNGDYVRIAHIDGHIVRIERRR